MPTIQVGPFALQRPVGRGGMGEVWRGYHAGQDVPVAVKVMTAKVFTTERNRDRFAEEVRAVAQLDHPGVVYVFDTGTVTAEAAAASGGRLVAGSPYLAMEFAGNGTLGQLKRDLAWPELQSILLALLDALAHAHAAGVIHRDLKPGNVLLCGARDLRPGLKLTDFGIASADASTRQDEVVGTLHYMAPEQIRAQVWAQGPHTDLYALGCLAWRLAAKQVPFHGRNGVELLAAQLHQRLPRLPGTVDAPPGFQDWIDQLTAKRPDQRYRRASDAAAALLALGTPAHAHTLAGLLADLEPHPDPDDTQPTLIPSDTRFLEEQLTVLARADRPPSALPDLLSRPVIYRNPTPISALTRAVGPRSDGGPRAGDPRPTHPPLPADWRRPDARRRSLQLLGAGLGLYGVRTIPLVGRERERDTLWAQLAAVHRTRQARVAIVRGAAGTGKSRLAAWLCQRAHEVGGASVLRARFAENDDAEGPLRRMLRGFLGIGPGDDLGEVVNAWLGTWGAVRDGTREALLGLLARGGGALDATSRHALLRMALEEIGRERPVIVWLDDVQWGQDGLRFVEALLAAQAVRPAPILAVLTVRDEALIGRGQEAGHVDGIALHADASTVRLRPLGRGERARLVQELLGLEPALGAQVEERSGGNPLFAVQLVGDWVQRGLLVPGPHGFELAAGEAMILPDDLTGVWSERITQLLDGLPADARWMFERAAVLGADVDASEWIAVCDDPDGRHRQAGRAHERPQHAGIRHALLQRLLASRLAEATGSGWVFGHGLLQETLQAEARAAGRWVEHNRAAARVLAHALRDDTAERLGRHLLEASEVDAAIGPLLRGARYRRLAVGRRSALRLLRTLEAAMSDRVPEASPLWAELLAEKGVTLYLMGQMVEARAVAHDLLDRAQRFDWAEARAAAAFRLGRIEMDDGALGAAEALLERAARDLADPTLRAEAHFFLSRIATMTRRWDRAKALEAEAVQLARELPDRRAQTLTELFLTEAAWDDDDMAKCGVHARRALKLAQGLGDLGTQLRCWNFAAEAARAAGDLEEAARDLAEAIGLAEVIGDARAPILKGNLALVHLAAGAFATAERELQEALFQARELGQAPVIGSLLSLLTHATAGMAAWPAFDDHITQAERVQHGLPMGEADCARALEAAGCLAASALYPQRARRALVLSMDHWTKLGRAADLNRVERFLATLPDL